MHRAGLPLCLRLHRTARRDADERVGPQGPAIASDYVGVDQ